MKDFFFGMIAGALALYLWLNRSNDEAQANFTPMWEVDIDAWNEEDDA